HDSVIHDCKRIFAARIVRGQDYEIATPSGSFAHQRTLGPVAVAATAEHSDDSTLLSCLLNEFSRQCSQISQRVVGMGIVDDYGERLLAIHPLETSRHADEFRRSSRDFFRLAVPSIRSSAAARMLYTLTFPISGENN